MPGTLGFTRAMTALLIVAFAAFAAGTVVQHSGEFSGVGVDARQNVEAVAGLIQDVALVAVGGLLVFAGIRGEDSPTGVRVALAILGLILVFHSVFSFTVATSLGGR